MKHELVKQLKDAGFPFYFENKEWYGEYVEDEKGSNLKTPPLSELIEACGDKYIENDKEYSFSLLWSIDKWFAGYSDLEFDRPKLPDGMGSTPEEAVAKLWLELNKKNG